MLVSMAGRQESFPAGTVRDIEDAMGKHLINVGFAEEVKEPKKEKKNVKVSTKNSTSKRASKSNGSKSTPKTRRNR
jgi:hypothetical protein